MTVARHLFIIVVMLLTALVIAMRPGVRAPREVDHLQIKPPPPPAPPRKVLP